MAQKERSTEEITRDYVDYRIRNIQEVLAKYGKKESDILWVGTLTHKTTWEKLKSTYCLFSIAEDSAECFISAIDEVNGLDRVIYSLRLMGTGWFIQLVDNDDYGASWQFVDIYPEPTDEFLIISDSFDWDSEEFIESRNYLAEIFNITYKYRDQSN